ncbi:hypothetical protein H3T86_00205 [Bifidobacterium sp. W8113]|uniref:hypothetical protein n=1 Tax=Bifidobacterium choladohabitans TaxID=2750947 RepID=UPI0018DDE189|nr:hypothetical protein [Bifidobacterium choladohabitans]MBI0089145.1 hypothetical protein [Bifidobacterium choladohabitans]
MGYRPGTMDDLDYRQRLIARTARQAVEAARATGTQSYGTTAKVKHQKIDIVHALDESAQARDAAAGAAKDAAGAADTAARAEDVAAGAADNAARAQDMASAATDQAAAAAGQAAAAVRTAGEAQAAAGAASVAADRAGRVAHRVDGSRVVAADVHVTPAIGPEPVTLVQVRVPQAAGYGRVRVSLAAFGSLLSSGPAVLQVRLRVGDRVTAWMAAAYAGDGVPYPGDLAPMRSFSLFDFEENVGQGALLAVEAVCPGGAWPAGLSGMAHLSARIDYMEVA